MQQDKQPSPPIRVGLFITCLTDTFFPRVGVAVLGVLRHFGCEVTFPGGQTCCGQPAYNSGLFPEARGLLERLPDLFADVDYVVSPSGSCISFVSCHGHEVLLSSDNKEQHARFVSKAFEFTTFLARVLKVDLGSLLPAPFEGKAGFHFPCHLRDLVPPDEALAGAKQLLGEALVPLVRFDQCCGFGGTFSIDAPEISDAMLEDKLRCIADSGAQSLVCNEGGCSLQIGGGLHRRGDGVRVVHVAEIIAEGLGIELPDPGGHR